VPPSAPPTIGPSFEPTPVPVPAATPAQGLVILEPADRSVAAHYQVVVRGLAQPGATITRDIPFWFDDHVVADSAGRWSMAVNLAEGENRLVFRVGDDRSTERVLTLYYRRP
jgi:hypothetical protein